MSEATALAEQQRLRRLYSGPIIDSDVHHDWPSDEAIIQYMPKRWRDIAPNLGLGPAPILRPHAGGLPKRIETLAPGGGKTGSDYDTLRMQLLEPYNVERAILSFDIGINTAVVNPEYATVIARAMHDWNADQWLSIGDDRLASVVIAPTQVPEEAAAEIRRVGQHPAIAEVLLVANGLGKPFGHPAYHPIYEAAHELGLPVAIHGGGEAVFGTVYTAAGGMPSYRLDYHVLAVHPAVHHVSSFLTNGVFEKYPDLRLLMVESGITWVPSLLWGLDAQYETIRRESTWVKRRPSEYFYDHVWVTTQPLELTEAKDEFLQFLECCEGLQDVLCFSTDYPHWDADDPLYIARRFPREWLPKIFHENARRLYSR